MSVRKISATKLSDYTGSRRSKPRINKLKSDRSSLLQEEKRLLELIFHDDAERASINAGMGRPREPMSVWVDSDQSWDQSILQPCELPAWEKLSERMKMFIGFDGAMEFGWCYSFNANISPTLVSLCRNEGMDLIGNIRQRLRRSMRNMNLIDLPFCYVVEARTKSGKSRNKPHLHGIVICQSPIDATRFKMALENALAFDLDGKRRRRAVKVERSYAKTNDPMGRFRWVSYITKNAHLYDARFGKRRVYITHSYTQIARLAWMVRRDDRLAA